MITITISNVNSKIDGLTEEQNNLLYNKLSYDLDSDIYLKLKNKDLFGIDMKKRLYQPKRCKFLTGLLPRVLHILNDPTIKLIDNRIYPDKHLYNPLAKELAQPRYYQSEANEIIKANPSTTIEMCTGSGKTNVIMSTIKDRGVNTIVLVPTLNLLDQFLDIAEYHFGSKLVGDHKSKKFKPITIANIQGVQRRDQEWWNNYEQVIIDEAHHQASSSYYDLNKNFWDHISYRLAVSATPYRMDGSDMKIEAITGPVLYTYSAKQAIKDKFIVPPHFLIYTVKHFGSLGRDWHWVYENSLVKNVYRNDKIIEIAKKFIKNGKTVLILANRIEHVNELAKRLPELLIITGETKKTNKKSFESIKLGEKQGAVATSQVLSEGIDIPQIDVLILGGGFESDIMISQAIGRTVRLDQERNKKYSIVVDFYDENEKILERHSESRFKLYAELFGPEYIKKMD